MTRKLGKTIAAAAFLALTTPAASKPGIAITIYANNMALVQDTRDLALRGGRQTIAFENVSAQIRSETVSLTAADLAIVEQNFDFDLLSPGKMMEKAVGKTVTIVRTNPATGAETREQAEVLAVNGGVVLRIGNRIEVLRDDGLPVRVIFDKVPDNLRAKPTLSILVDAKPGNRPAVLSYLTPGLGWRADYVALYDEAAGQIDVQGWVTLTNASGVTYDDAETLLVAGNPKLLDSNDDQRWQRPRPTMVEAGTESGTRERLGDYYLYPLAARTTIANQQTKQVSFLDVHGAPARHGYEARLNWLQTIEQPISTASVYEFSNSAQGGLGDQLPAGIMRFYLRDKRGSPQFIGESRIDHTPMGSTLSLNTGDAFDVKVKSTTEKRERINSDRWKTAMRYTLTNALPKPVSVKLIQNGLWGDTRITAQSQPAQRTNADSAIWTVTVPANGKSEVTATFDTRF
ncbi:hypothetical protein GCM10011529_01980 [Polymorphobacter glacialis]|uniref:DUF4139 domain-containing protein n=1 Tax=Sandarakinorhabdus glacialis TaxID=1614636 RepID=A0A916ZJI8_9SPHN|nr:DUF4139 domain-containing protein [Polymorphobacter glacialis]GGD99447.1 hypothetical protein GCM10011529_01980 [Polymorphobacter glacialis]